LSDVRTYKQGSETSYHGLSKIFLNWERKERGKSKGGIEGFFRRCRSEEKTMREAGSRPLRYSARF